MKLNYNWLLFANKSYLYITHKHILHYLV